MIFRKNIPAVHINSCIQSLEEFDNHEMVIALSDKTSGLKAYVAIHNSKLGPAHGGTRMKFYDNEGEAIKDVLKLSRAMSYKSAMASLPYGGAKGVIHLDPQSVDKTQVLIAYAKKLELLNGLFRTGTDVGMTDQDALLLARHCSYILGIPKSDNQKYSTSTTAARGVYLAIKTAVEFKYGSADLNNRMIGVKGVGKLGSELVKLLIDAGARVFIADMDARRIDELKSLFPSVHELKSDTIHKHRLDVYAPCALGNEFNIENVKELSCDIVTGGANNQLSTPQAGDIMHQQGILYAPDYIVNAGGLIFVSEDLESDGFHIDRIHRRLASIQTTLTAVFDRSMQENIPTHRIADMIAEERINGIKK